MRRRPNCDVTSILAAAKARLRRAGSPRAESVLVGVFVALELFAGSVARHLLPGAFNDDAVYMVLGRALSTGAGYRSIYLAGAPLQVKYPPGLPALLAVLWTFCGTASRVQAIATTINIAACAAAASIFWWFGLVRLGMSRVIIAAFVILPFLFDPAVQYFTLVLSEPLALLATAGSLLLYSRVREEEADTPTSRRVSSRHAVALGLTLAAAALVRTQGVALAVAMLLALAFERELRRRLAITAVAALAPLAAWNLFLAAGERHATLATQASEISYVSFLFTGTPLAIVRRELHAVRDNLLDYVGALGSYITGSPRAGTIICLALGMLAVTGSALLARRSRELVFVFAANAVVILAWPVYQDRFLLPVLPLLGLVSGNGLHSLMHRGRWERHSVSRGTVLALVALAAGAVLVRQHWIRHDAEMATREHRRPAVDTPTFWLPGNAWFVETVSHWALDATRADDRIAVVSPAGLWLYTGRPTVPMEIVEPRGLRSVFDEPGRYLASRLVADSVTVVVVESPSGTTASEVAAVRAACPDALVFDQSFSGIGAVRAQPGNRCVLAMNTRFESTRR